MSAPTIKVIGTMVLVAAILAGAFVGGWKGRDMRQWHIVAVPTVTLAVAWLWPLNAG